MNIRAYLLSITLNVVLAQNVVSFSNGMNFTAFYDASLGKVHYTVNVPKNSYFAIGYGWNMDHTDMCYWGANGSSSLQ